MSDQPWTPGPWHAAPGHIHDAEGHHLASIEKRGEERRQTEWPDARLIAAAPRLVNLIIMSDKWFPGNGESRDVMDILEDMADWRRTALTLLREIRGEVDADTR